MKEVIGGVDSSKWSAWWDIRDSQICLSFHFRAQLTWRHDENSTRLWWEHSIWEFAAVCLDFDERELKLCTKKFLIVKTQWSTEARNVDANLIFQQSNKHIVVISAVFRTFFSRTASNEKITNIQICRCPTDLIYFFIYSSLAQKSRLHQHVVVCWLRIAFSRLTIIARHPLTAGLALCVSYVSWARATCCRFALDLRVRRRQRRCITRFRTTFPSHKFWRDSFDLSWFFKLQ